MIHFYFAVAPPNETHFWLFPVAKNRRNFKLQKTRQTEEKKLDFLCVEKFIMRAMRLNTDVPT